MRAKIKLKRNSPTGITKPKSKRRANSLEGKEWLRNSVSIWSDIRLSPEERKLKHPSLFPEALADRVIKYFVPPGGLPKLLDPYMGSGSTLLAGCANGVFSYGCDLSQEYVELTERRMRQRKYQRFKVDSAPCHLAGDMLGIKPDSLSLVFTSPPYWDILSQKRTADGKTTRDYSEDTNDRYDLSLRETYTSFVSGLIADLYSLVPLITPGGYMVVNCMDLRKGPIYYPLHSDLMQMVTDPFRDDVQPGLLLDDVIIWDRRADYNNLRPLGYPYCFRVNKAHEYLLIFRREKA